MQRRHSWIIGVLLAGIALWAWQGSNQVGEAPAGNAASQVETQRTGSTERIGSSATTAAPAWLPREAVATVQRIERGGPFPYRQDGGVFQNRERRLPSQPGGWYREYTVDTPGSRDRGARRIIAAGDPPVAYFYTDDHYRSFRRFDAAHAP